MAGGPDPPLEFEPNGTASYLNYVDSGAGVTR